MPNNNNDEDLTNLSIEEINDLFSDIIEFPENVRLSYTEAMPSTMGKNGMLCGGK